MALLFRSLAGLGAVLALAACGQGGTGASIPDWGRQTAHYYQAPGIRAGDVEKLGVAWEFRDFVVRGRTNRGVEATPVVVDGVMYVTGPWSVVYALDAKTGGLLWQYDPEADGEFARRTCCDAVNRGVAVADGVVYVASLDGYLIGLDAASGKELWKTDTIVDRKMSYAITGAPRVSGRNVVIGNGGGEMGGRGYVAAYDRKTGKLAWRFFIVPGDPAKGPDEHPEVTEARKTWGADTRWDLGGGGNAWDSIVYDPDTNIVYVGTGNGSPHPGWSRSPGGGDNLYLSSIVAIDADTGRKKWHYQTTPNDSWDYTATQNMILADLTLDGKRRKVIMQAPKNGFFYVLDRVTGELLSAEKFTTVTWADRVDIKTGRPVVSAQADYSKDPKLIWPSEAGGHNWQPMAFSEESSLVYIPVLQAPMVFQTSEAKYRPYSNVQGSVASFPAPDATGPMFDGQPKPRFDAVLKAWDPVAQKEIWSSEPMPFFSGGAMATSRGLVFQGSAEGDLSVYDARTGKVLRRIALGTAIMASPMAYEVDGEQYVAVAAGFGGALNLAYPPGSAPQKYENGSRLIVFKIGGAAPAMPAARVDPPFTDAPAKFRGDAAQAERGMGLYLQNCVRCHGMADMVGGYPNLWKMSDSAHENFNEIVLDGAYAYAGMAAFRDVLSPRDVADIHAFLAAPRQGATAAPKRMH